MGDMRCALDSGAGTGCELSNNGDTVPPSDGVNAIIKSAADVEEGGNISGP